jgi:hypothetical protein
MKKISLKVLKQLHDKRELTMPELFDMVNRKYSDHRDFIFLSNLLLEGYITAAWFISPKLKGANMDAYTLSNFIEDHCRCYEKKFRKDEKQKYGNFILKKTREDIVRNKYPITPLLKCDLFFYELKQKRNDRFFSTVIAIVVGILIAFTKEAILK